MPLGEALDFIEMAEALEAQERMDAVIDAAAALGRLKGGAASHLQTLQRVSRRRPGARFRDARPASPEPRDPEQAAGRLSQIGVGLKLVKRKAGDDG